MDTVTTYLKQSRFLQQVPSIKEPQSSYSYFSNINSTHIISIVVFILTTIALFYLIKRNLIKFLGFFHFRKDYMRFQALNQEQTENDISQLNCYDSNDNKLNHDTNQQLKTAKKYSPKIEQIKQNLKRNIREGFVRMHSLISIFHSLFSNQPRIRLPRPIVFTIFLITAIINLTLCIALTHAAQSMCLNQRTFLNTLYICQSTDLQVELDLPKKLGIAIAVSIVVCSLTLTVTHIFTRNYFKFMTKLLYPKSMKNTNNSSMRPLISESISVLPSQKKNEKPMKSDPKKSSRANLLESNSAAMFDKQNLFKIQEIDEEQPQSPPIAGKKKNVLGEIQNVVKLDSSSQNKNIKSALNQSYSSQEENMNPKNFYESYENSHTKGGIASQVQQNINYIQKKPSCHTFEDQTTIIEGHMNLQNITMSRHLEGIREEEFEGTYQNNCQTKEDPPNVFEENIQKIEDNSRLNMLSQNSEQQLINKSKKKSIFDRFGTFLMILLVILFFGGILFNIYSFFHMTDNGLKIAFSIFGMAFLIDMVIIRTVAILSIAMIKSLNTKEIPSQIRNLNKKTMDQISRIYEEYEVHFEDYEKVGTQSQIFQEDLEKDQLKPSISKQSFHQPKKRSIGDFVLIEKPSFYQAPIHLLINRNDGQNDTNRNDIEQNPQTASIVGGKKNVKKGEKVEITNTISFRAEDCIIKKPYIAKKDPNYDEESQYDIEEIPMQSSRNKLVENDNLIMPNAQQQFETPKPNQNGKNKLKDPKASMFVSQVVTFNDGEQEARKSILRDLLGLSGSKKGSPNKSEYQSLKKYLAQERQSSIESMQENQKFQSPNKKVNQKTSQILDKENINDYNPQYNTLTKIQQNQKSSKSNCKKNTESKIFDIKNGSDEDKSVFSDLKNVNIKSELELKKYHSSKKVMFSISKKSHAQFNDIENGQLSRSSTKKCEFDKENIIGKTVDIKPNHSPFNVTKNLAHDRSERCEFGQNITSFHQNSSMKNIPAFGQISKGGKTIIENMGIGDHHHSSLDLTQPGLKKNASPEGKNWGSVTRTVEDSIDNNVKNLLKGKRKFKKNENIEISEMQLQQLGSINSNDFQDSEESLRSKTSKFKLQKVQMTKKSKRDKSVKAKKGSKKIKNSKEYDDTNRSRIYEDENNTYRLVNFGQKQSSVQQLNLNQYSSKGIDFYSNTQTLEPDKSKDEQNLPQKISFIHIEESPDRSKKDQASNPIILKQGETSPSSNECEIQAYQSKKGTISRMMHDINKQDLIDAAHEAEDLSQKFCSRQSIGHDNKKSSTRKRKSSRKDQPSQDYDDQHQNQQLPSTRPKRFKKDDDDTKLRIEEQKRKLTGFLKLAKQLKSSKDEQIIIELLEIIKETKKPLPMSKINELKKLELMASPYNQSLIAMIKDEYESFRKSMKAPTAARSSKSQQRSDFKNEAVVKHLSGIYGSNATQLSNRKGDGNKSIKTSSMTREDTTNSKFTSALTKAKVKNAKSIVRESAKDQPTIQNDGVIRIQKKNTQLPIIGYQSAIDVNSSLSHVGITSEDEHDLNVQMREDLEMKEEDEEDVNERDDL